MDYTLVVGVDKRHLEQLALTWPTWMRNKPSLRTVPMVLFYDPEQVGQGDIANAIEWPRPNLRLVAWGAGKDYGGDPSTKFFHPQRYKMLSGFVHVPAKFVETRYWLKLDTDVVAINPPKGETYDNWIDPTWFRGIPAIVAHGWGFTKPANQMVVLDEWVKTNEIKLPELASRPPLNLSPEEGSDRLSHKRIISWCGFFNTRFTRSCSEIAERVCGNGKLPVPSQDGYLWYCAARQELPIVTTFMKKTWQQWSTSYNVARYAKEAME